MSDTPRTDGWIEESAFEDKNHPHTDWVPASFARELQRELSQLKAAINSTWIAAYPDCPKRDDAESLKTRVIQLGVDRGHWVENHRALQKGYNQIESKLNAETRRLDWVLAADGDQLNLLDQWDRDNIDDAMDREETDLMKWERAKDEAREGGEE